ncbi:uncharacterized protein [Nicotiana tomentosiformis]|uniref:uncharacterized protein n=1 Tax=Nicotiana tomentosiformis TaxID=4098 RepID=UPI00388C4655
MGIVEMSSVVFTTFQLKGAAYQWWRAYEVCSPAKAASLIWDRFSEFFLREFVPQTLRDSWRMEFELLLQALVATVRERVCRFIERLNQSIRYNMVKELESDPLYQQVVEIARRLEGMRDRDRDDREAKRSRGIGGFSGGHAAASSYYSRGYMSRPVHSVLLASSGAPVVPRSQVAHFPQPISSVPPARGAFNSHSARPRAS